MAEIIYFEPYKNESREENHSDDNTVDQIDEIIQEIENGFWDL